MLADASVGSCASRVRFQQIFCDQSRFGPTPPARRMPSFDVSFIHHHPRLVERRPHRDPIVELAIHQSRVLGKPLWRIGIGPSTAIFDRLWQVPMVERRRWLNAVLEQRVDETAVKINAGTIYFA